MTQKCQQELQMLGWSKTLRREGTEHVPVAHRLYEMEAVLLLSSYGCPASSAESHSSLPTETSLLASSALRVHGIKAAFALQCHNSWHLFLQQHYFSPSFPTPPPAVPYTKIAASTAAKGTILTSVKDGDRFKKRT
jgi:hypothetical protein